MSTADSPLNFHFLDLLERPLKLSTLGMDGAPSLTTRKTLIGVNLLVTGCFGVALLLRAAAWKNTPRYHYRPVGGVTAL
jgi:hypothetical protein